MFQTLSYATNWHRDEANQGSHFSYHGHRLELTARNLSLILLLTRSSLGHSLPILWFVTLCSQNKQDCIKRAGKLNQQAPLLDRIIAADEHISSDSID
jgi:hypothetical protein